VKDAAAKIAGEGWYNTAEAHKALAARIRAAIRRAVKAERERCVDIILESDTPGTPGKYERRYMLEAIVEKIQAKRPSKRK
jgi:methionine synthase II (cobalamin-independent)